LDEIVEQAYFKIFFSPVYTSVFNLAPGSHSLKSIISVFSLLLAAIFCLSQPAAAQSSDTTPELTIPWLYTHSATGRPPQTVKWSPDGARVSFLLPDSGEKTSLYAIDAATGKQSVLVPAEKIAAMAPAASQTKDDRQSDNRARYNVAGYHWAPDSQHLLFDANGQLWLYSLASGTSAAMSAPGDSVGDPKFSPDGKKLAWVRDHNLFVRPVGEGAAAAITADKDENILNGEVDWVYAEELEVRSNYFWSPDSRHIVFLQMNETKVPTYPITDFIPQHPTVSETKYPKVGDPNPEVRLGVVSAEGGPVQWIEMDGSKDIYVPRFGWAGKGLVWFEVLNRAQNQLDLYLAEAATGKAHRILSEKSDTWIEMDNNFRMLAAGNRFLWSSWRDGNTHLYLYSFDPRKPLETEARLERQITRGNFEVLSIEALNEAEASGTLFLMTTAVDVRQRHLCSVKLDGGDFKILTQSRLGVHNVEMASGGKYFVDSFSMLMTPPEVSFCRVGGGCSTFWRSKSIGALNLTSSRFIDFKAEDGTELHGELLLPPAQGDRKFPVLLAPYGGPLGQSVIDAWGGNGLLFSEILMRDGIAVLTVDNRGMGHRGRKFAAAMMHNFGEVELRDQLAALDQVLARFPQLDGSRVGIWGWSYGGFMTLYAMTHSQRFKTGVAVAPVTDYLNYDTIYTERYGGLLPGNAAAYHRSAPVYSAASLHGHLLEVHGTSDDNVHMQNTIQMVNAFINAGKKFELMLYPRKTHGIGGSQARIDLFTRIREHLGRDLLGVQGAKTE